MRSAMLAAAWVLGGAMLAGCGGTISPEGQKLLTDGQAAYLRQDDAAAIAACTEFIRQYPKAQEAGEAHYLRGLAELRKHDADGAHADFAAAIQLSQRKDVLARSNLELGKLAYDANDMREAELRFRAALDNIVPAGAQPADQALYRLGEVLQRVGRWNDADLYFSKLAHFFQGSDTARWAEDRINAKRWSVQAGAFAAPEGSAALQAKLRAAGLNPREDVERRAGKLMRLVRVGDYATYDAARPELARVKAAIKAVDPKDEPILTPAR